MAATSSLSGEGYLLKVGLLSFRLPVIASDVSNPIVENKDTEDNNNISTTVLFGSGNTSHPLVFGLQAPHQKISGGFTDYSSRRGTGDFKFGSSTGGS